MARGAPIRRAVHGCLVGSPRGGERPRRDRGTPASPSVRAIEPPLLPGLVHLDARTSRAETCHSFPCSTPACPSPSESPIERDQLDFGVFAPQPSPHAFVKPLDPLHCDPRLLEPDDVARSLAFRVSLSHPASLTQPHRARATHPVQSALAALVHGPAMWPQPGASSSWGHQPPPHASGFHRHPAHHEPTASYEGYVHQVRLCSTFSTLPSSREADLRRSSPFLCPPLPLSLYCRSTRTRDSRSS